MSEEAKTTSPTNQKTEEKTAPAKKVKPPALEDKPFTEFMEQHFMVSLENALNQKGLENVTLNFKKGKIPVVGFESNDQCWQVMGNLKNRQFCVYFLDENINGQKAFSCSNNGQRPSTLESFMIDERKSTLDLMILFLLQRLNGQKWLARN